ncbi:hypothetical protein BKA93DRAFT_750293 [Sparassis latifolia]
MAAQLEGVTSVIQSLESKAWFSAHGVSLLNFWFEATAMFDKASLQASYNFMLNHGFDALQHLPGRSPSSRCRRFEIPPVADYSAFGWAFLTFPQSFLATASDLVYNGARRRITYSGVLVFIVSPNDPEDLQGSSPNATHINISHIDDRVCHRQGPEGKATSSSSADNQQALHSVSGDMTLLDIKVIPPPERITDLRTFDGLGK